MTCSVDCVTTRPNVLRNSNCTRDRTTLDGKDLSKLAMSAWRVAKRVTPGRKNQRERQQAAQESASARSAASYEDTLGRSIVSLQKKKDQEIRELAGALTDFWLAPKTLQTVKAGMEAGPDYMEEVKK